MSGYHTNEPDGGDRSCGREQRAGDTAQGERRKTWRLYFDERGRRWTVEGPLPPKKGEYVTVVERAGGDEAAGFSEEASVEEWMEAPVSPLSNEQIKQLAAAVVASGDAFQPNEVYLTDKDSLALWGETAVQALEALAVARAALASAGSPEAEAARVAAALDEAEFGPVPDEVMAEVEAVWPPVVSEREVRERVVAEGQSCHEAVTDENGHLDACNAPATGIAFSDPDGAPSTGPHSAEYLPYPACEKHRWRQPGGVALDKEAAVPETHSSRGGFRA